MPKLLKSKKDTVGIRVPEHAITQALVAELGHPIMSVSLPMDVDVEYYTDPELMYDAFEHVVDLVIDGGIGGTVPSTVVDCSNNEMKLIREGAGEWISEE